MICKASYLASALIIAGIAAGCAKRQTDPAPSIARAGPPAATQPVPQHVLPAELTAQQREEVLRHRREEVLKRQEERRLLKARPASRPAE